MAFPKIAAESQVWGLGILSTNAAQPPPPITFQPEGGQDGLGDWASGTPESTQIHSPKNMLKVWHWSSPSLC